MGRGPTKKCPLTGRKLSDLADLPDASLTASGTLKAVPGLEVYDVRTFAALGGYKDHYYFETKVLPSSLFHAEQIKLGPGQVIYATTVQSAKAGGLVAKARADDAHTEPPPPIPVKF